MYYPVKKDEYIYLCRIRIPHRYKFSRIVATVKLTPVATATQESSQDLSPNIKLIINWHVTVFPWRECVPSYFRLTTAAVAAAAATAAAAAAVSVAVAAAAAAMLAVVAVVAALAVTFTPLRVTVPSDMHAREGAERRIGGDEKVARFIADDAVF